MKMKKLLLVIAIIIGFSTSANAQFFQKLKEAVSTVKDAYDAGKDAYDAGKNIYNDVKPKEQAPQYSSLGTTRGYYFTDISKSSTSLEIVKMSDGSKKVLRNGKPYNYYENYSYDSYSSNSNDKSYYKYYAEISGCRYYFNW